MDPCGAVMDYGRSPHTTIVRPFKDSDATAKIAWRFAAPGAKCYPHMHAFQSRSWTVGLWSQLSGPWCEFTGPGEVWATPRVYNGRRAIPGLTGEHPCGPPEWFAEGMPFDPDRPPCERDVNGIPLCCHSPQIFVTGGLFTAPSGWSYTEPRRGGIEIGGPVGDVFAAADPLAGGVEVGGEVGDQWIGPYAARGGVEVGGEVGDRQELLDATAGGVEIGGEVGDDFTPPAGWQCRSFADVTAGQTVFPPFALAPYTVTPTASSGGLLGLTGVLSTAIDSASIVFNLSGGSATGFKARVWGRNAGGGIEPGSIIQFQTSGGLDEAWFLDEPFEFEYSGLSPFFWLWITTQQAGVWPAIDILCLE